MLNNTVSVTVTKSATTKMTGTNVMMIMLVICYMDGQEQEYILSHRSDLLMVILCRRAEARKQGARIFALLAHSPGVRFNVQSSDTETRSYKHS